MLVRKGQVEVINEKSKLFVVPGSIDEALAVIDIGLYIVLQLLGSG